MPGKAERPKKEPLSAKEQIRARARANPADAVCLVRVRRRRRRDCLCDGPDLNFFVCVGACRLRRPHGSISLRRAPLDGVLDDRLGQKLPTKLLHA